MMSRLIWRGTAQAVSLHNDTGKLVWEGTLAPGREVRDLPLSHPFVIGWLDAGLLTPAPDEADDPPRTRRKSTRAIAADAAQSADQEG